jgi:adenylosuccinate synthase
VHLVEELRGLEAKGIDISPERILLSDRAHLITPSHLALDAARESQRGLEAIGTTKRGIGPAYTDKAARDGLRAETMRDPGQFAERVGERIEVGNRLLTDYYRTEPLNVEQVVGEWHSAAQYLAPYVKDVSPILHDALAAAKTILCEGAQGTLLDIDHGGYPFVTSSSTTVGGAITGLGIPPHAIDRVIGVAKAFSTRVGAGPMPTELHDELGSRLRGTGENPWDEFGTTTGRPRRTGWFDAVVVRYAARINGLTELVVTKLDVLSGFETLKIASGYRLEGQPTEWLPSEMERLAKCEPVYETAAGWIEDIMRAQSFAELPPAARKYVERIEALTVVPVKFITVGPAREQSIRRD